MAIPDYQSLMLPVLRLADEGETRVPDAAEKLAHQLGLSVAEREEMLPSGRQRIFHNRIHWAKFYMTKAGLIDSPARGRFVASHAGRALLATNPAGLNVDTLKTYPAFAEFYASSTSGAGSTDAASAGTSESIDAATSATPEEQIDAAQAVLHQALKAELLQRFLAQSPAFFERAIVDLLVGMGYGGSHENAARRLGKTGDGGIDGVIDEDRLGLDRIYVQAKRYAPHVGVGRPEVQGFLGSLVGVGAGKGVFVTTSNFSAPAIDFVRHLPQRIVLIDGDRLADLMIEHGVGVRIARTVEVKRLDEDFFVDE
ncbi:restriction endonuclease [Rhizobium leguminosarum]|uniref:restriction endonuclease n=1 Tax=Rhizobium leguminosarum TaxID=384 RepID=UPI00103DE489|nr:restriction endonuclease [Rhizobium leguminosarum]MBY5478316.1 restriction endonuclease [Rhizobium leguminosarum]NKK15128.1 restriction endonuclease [Rhizobium leguminosarum bv. viciae]TBZ56445.1 restriction endonuclease [Rhizobium leguminosarum bv. viciae]